MGKLKVQPDCEVTDSAQDAFKHRSIALVIRDLVLDCPRPFCIGLFGKWGTGKSTIIKFLTAELEGNEKLGVVSFDVWKYRGDSLRRAFLIEAERQLKKNGFLPGDYKIDRRVTENTLTTKSGLQIDWGKLASSSLASFLVAILIFDLLRYAFGSAKDIYEAVGLSAAISAAIGFINSVTNIFEFKSDSITHDRLSLPEEFELEFAKMIESLTRGNVLFVIDNLDRCSHDQAVLLLTTLKTFLERSKCLYLIPCDDVAIVEHLRHAYGSSPSFDGNEYLRKFFNATVRIPVFIDSDLDHYTDSLLRASGFQESSDLSLVIATACRESPRKIKQFINSLIFQLELAVAREEHKELIPSGAVSSNVPFLAKIILLQQQWPKFYEQLQIDPEILDEVNAHFRAPGAPLRQIVQDNPDLRVFLRATQWVTAKNIRAFLYLKQSKEDLSIEGSDELRLALIDNAQERIVQRMQICQSDAANIPKFEKFICDLFREFDYRQSRQLNILSGSLAAIAHFRLEFSVDYFNVVAVFLNQNHAMMRRLPAGDLFFLMGHCDVGVRGDLASAVVEAFEISPSELQVSVPHSDDYFSALASEIARNSSWFTAPQIERLQVAISRQHWPRSAMLRPIAASAALREKIFSRGMLAQIGGALSEQDILTETDLPQKINSARIEVMMQCASMTDHAFADALCVRLHTLLGTERSQQNRPERSRFLDVAIFLLNQFGSGITDPGSSNNLAAELNAGFVNATDQSIKARYLVAMVALRKVLTNVLPARTQTNNWITVYTQNQPIQVLNEVLTNLARFDLISAYDGIAGDQFLNRASNTPELFEHAWPIIPDARRTELQARLLSQGLYDELLKHLEKRDFNIPGADAFARDIIAKANTLSNISQRETLLRTAIRVKCAWHNDLRLLLADSIKAMLTVDSPGHQEAGVRVFDLGIREGRLEDEIYRRDIAGVVLDFLEKKTNISNGYDAACSSIVLGWSVLQEAVKLRFVTLIVFNWIERSNAPQEIIGGISILRSTGIRFNAVYKGQFEGLRQKALKLTGENPARAEIRNYLVGVRDEKAPHDEEFWESVRGIPD